MLLLVKNLKEMFETRIHATQLHLHRDRSPSLFPLICAINVVINTREVVGSSDIFHVKKSGKFDPQLLSNFTRHVRLFY